MNDDLVYYQALVVISLVFLRPAQGLSMRTHADVIDGCLVCFSFGGGAPQ